MYEDLWMTLKPYLRKARIALGVPSGKHPFKRKPRPAWKEVAAHPEIGATLPAGEVVAGCLARSPRAKREFLFAVRKSRPGDTTVIDEVYCHDTYRLAKIADKPRVIFDFGAHIGTFTVLLKQLFPDAHVYCFEPHPTSFALLQANTAHLTDVHLFNKALSYSDDALLFEAADCTGGNFVAAPGRAQAYEGTPGGPGSAAYRALKRVEAISLEEIFRVTGVQSVDLVKWDCEGGEVDAFRHMTPASAARFRRMVGEYHVESGGARAFLELASGRFPGHHFYGRDEDPDQNIGWFAAERRAA